MHRSSVSIFNVLRVVGREHCVRVLGEMDGSVFPVGRGLLIVLHKVFIGAI
jgi:hypothetical protein